jgi:hypothetical protein
MSETEERRLQKENYFLRMQMTGRGLSLPPQLPEKATAQQLTEQNAAMRQQLQ